ncbi:MAG: FHA domain-containing protein, partial [Planctomycetes bacterium]|nr:FHA domain-containing protein [Planctomycetota bacterium]
MAVHDLGSSNGTYKNNHKLDRPTLFDPNCVLQVGDFLLRLTPASAAPAAPAPAAHQTPSPQ